MFTVSPSGVRQMTVLRFCQVGARQVRLAKQSRPGGARLAEQSRPGGDAVVRELVLVGIPFACLGWWRMYLLHPRRWRQPELSLSGGCCSWLTSVVVLGFLATGGRQ